MTKSKSVSGMSTDGYTVNQVEVTVRATKDEHGKTISFEDGECLIGVPIESIEDILKWLEK